MAEIRTLPSGEANLATGFAFPEGLRWHDETIWFSDMHTGDVFTLDPDTGQVARQFTVDDQPSGMGWLPDGSLLLSLMLARRVLRRRPDGTEEIYADLTAVSDYPVNEMVVDDRGRAYIGTFGYDIYAGAPRQPASVFRIDPDGSVTHAAGGFDFPNGTVILPGTQTIVIAHSFRPELTGFDIAEDGSLVNRRVWAHLPEGTTADGLAVDSRHRIWVSSILTSEFLRVAENGSVDLVVNVPGRLAVDCVVDGRDDSVVYFSTSTSIQPAETRPVMGGCIERIDV